MCRYGGQYTPSKVSLEQKHQLLQFGRVLSQLPKLIERRRLGQHCSVSRQPRFFPHRRQGCTACGYHPHRSVVNRF